ncbi:MAG: T9SS type A sorting domain-containing protein [Bacteroidetes bacterium]|nr:T9SS type A sorting domain-containing protein [Bacteroidota bacterium]
MKKIIITLLLLASIPSFAQMAQQWQKQFGFPQYGGAYPWGMVMDDSSNIYNICQVVTLQPTLTTTIDPVIYKLNRNGEIVWYKNLGLDFFHEEHPMSIKIDSNNQIYFLCSINDSSRFNIHIFKFNTSGEIIWNKKIAMSDYSDRHKIELNENGVIYTNINSLDLNYAYQKKLYKINSSGSTIDSIGISSNNLSASIEDFTISKNGKLLILSKSVHKNDVKSYISLADSSHNVLWTKELNYSGYPSNMQFANDSSMYVCFYRNELLYGIVLDLYKYDVNGNLMWFNETLGPIEISNYVDYEKLYPKLLISNDNNLLCFSTAKTFLFSTRETFLIRKLNANNGDSIWTFRVSDYISSSSQLANALIDSSGNIYACGNANFSYSTGNSYVIAKLSSFGQLLRLTKNENVLSYRFEPQNIILNKNNELYVNGAYSLPQYGHEMSMTIKYSQPVNVSPMENSMPEKFSLYQNYPNPFNPNTVISFQLPVHSFVNIKVFDINGREVSELVNEKLSAGEYKINFNGALLSSGVYYYKMTTENFSETKKMILVK